MRILSRTRAGTTLGLVLAAALLLTGCSDDEPGTAATPTVPEPRAGLLVAHPSVDGRPDVDTILLLDARGEQVRSIDSGGASAPARVLDDGRVLLDGDGSPVILDTRTGKLTPISWDSEVDLGPMDNPPSITVAEAGGWLLLGDANMGQLGLVNLRTGEGTVVHELLDARFIRAASLNRAGTYLTVITENRVATIPTAEPQNVVDLVADTTVIGSFDATGNRIAVVTDFDKDVGTLSFGTAGSAELTDSGVQARAGFPVRNGTLAIVAGGTELLSADGTRTDLGIDVLQLLVRTPGYLVVATEDERYLSIDLDEPVAATELAGLQGMHRIGRLDGNWGSGSGSSPAGADDVVVMMPNNYLPDAETVVVIDADGVRTISVEPYVTQTATQLPGDRLLVETAPDAEEPGTTRLIDLRSGSVLLEVADRRLVTAAPDGSAFVVAPTGEPGPLQIVPADGSERIELPQVAVIGWATASAQG